MSLELAAALGLTALTLVLFNCWFLGNKSERLAESNVTAYGMLGTFLCFPCMLIAWSIFLPYGMIYAHVVGAFVVFVERIWKGRKVVLEDPINEVPPRLIVSVVFGFPPAFIYLLGRRAYQQITA